MKWIFDWKCSLYSLTVCLDSMSPVLLFFFFFFSPLFCHILQQWYFLYLRITGQNTKQNKPIRIPLQLGSLEWNRTKLGEQLQNAIFVVDSHCFRQGFYLDYNGGGNGTILHLFYPFFFSRGPIFTISLVSLNVGATPERHNNSILVMAKGQFLLYNHSHTECW